MTSIGVFLQNVPTGRDVFAGLDQTAATDAAHTGSDAKGDSFGALLTNLAQPAQEATAASTATQGPGASIFAGLAANGALAADAQSRGADQSADQANLVASLATAAALPGKSAARAADGFVQSADAGEDMPGHASSTDAKTQANPVTSLLGSLSQDSADASANAARNLSPTDASALGANTLTEFAASSVQAGSGAKTAVTEQGAAAPSKAVQAGQGTAVASKAMPVAKETAVPPKTAITKQAIAAASKAGLTDLGTAVSSETGLLEEGTSATTPSQPSFDQTAADATQQTSLATTNGNPRAVARTNVQASGQPNGQIAGLAQTSELAAPVSSSKAAPDNLAGSPSATATRRARASGENSQGGTLATADASSILTAATQVSSLAAPLIVATAPSDVKKAASTNSTATPPFFSNRAGSTGSGLVANDPSVVSISNALDAATTLQSLPATSPDSFQIQVTGLSAATHFAPVARLSAVQQISDAVAATFSSPFGAQNSSAASAADVGNEAGASGSADALALLAQPSAASIKTLDLQLQPETLGQVTIKLNLSESGLAVQVETANQQTAELIGKDKQALTQSLSASGYSVASLDVSVAPQNASHFSSDASSQQGQADPNSGQSGGQPSGNNGSPNGGRMHDPSALPGPTPGAQNLAATDGAASVAGNTGRSGLFV
jgi:hypothetical protein